MEPRRHKDDIVPLRTCTTGASDFLRRKVAQDVQSMRQLTQLGCDRFQRSRAIGNGSTLTAAHHEASSP